VGAKRGKGHSCCSALKILDYEGAGNNCDLLRKRCCLLLAVCRDCYCALLAGHAEGPFQHSAHEHEARHYLNYHDRADEEDEGSVTCLNQATSRWPAFPGPPPPVRAFVPESRGEPDAVPVLP
jgi:hypothetical protein